jgi:hypothetical protein
MRGKRLVALFVTAAMSAVFLLGSTGVAFAVAKDKYESDGSLSSAKSITVTDDVKTASIQLHNFDSSKDIDYVKFNASKGVTYKILPMLGDSRNLHNTLKIYVYRYDKAHHKWITQKTYYMASRAGGYINLKAGYTATYALGIRSWDYGKSGVAGCTYGIRVQKNVVPSVKLDSYEGITDTATSPTQLAVTPYDYWGLFYWSGTTRYNTFFSSAVQLHSIDAASGSTDDDWYAFIVPAGKDANIETYLGYYKTRTLEYTLYNSSISPIAGYSGSVTGNYHSVPLPSDYSKDVTYYLKVSGTFAGTGQAPFWYRIGAFYDAPPTS